ncbi:MAG: peptide deformylase [Armatimonadota bacterium]
MAVRQIVLYPDPILKQVCAEIAPGIELAQAIARDLEETLDSGPGVGLAAPQIGYAYRVILVDAARNPKRHGQGRFVLFNPEIRARHGEQVVREGCLSIPDYTANIRRAEEVVVCGIGRDGEPVEVRARDYEAVVFQHEIDHLDGILFLDRVRDVKKELFRRKPRAEPGGR